MITVLCGEIPHGLYAHTKVSMGLQRSTAVPVYQNAWIPIPEDSNIYIGPYLI
jgi:hypothetical protein